MAMKSILATEDVICVPYILGIQRTLKHETQLFRMDCLVSRGMFAISLRIISVQQEFVLTSSEKDFLESLACIRCKRNLDRKRDLKSF